MSLIESDMLIDLVVTGGDQILFFLEGEAPSAVVRVDYYAGDGRVELLFTGDRRLPLAEPVAEELRRVFRMRDSVAIGHVDAEARALSAEYLVPLNVRRSAWHP